MATSDTHALKAPPSYWIGRPTLTGDFRFLKSGPTKRTSFPLHRQTDCPFSFSKQMAIEHGDNLIDRKASARSRLEICADSPQGYGRSVLICPNVCQYFLIGSRPTAWPFWPQQKRREETTTLY